MTRTAGCLIGLFLISIALGSVSASALRVQAPAEAGVSDEEYEIYSAVIKQIYVAPETKMVIIEERTFRYDFGNQNEEFWKEKHKGVNID